MNYDLNKYKFSMLDNIFQGVQEIPVDCDLTLPDYCPDIGKILKCQISAGVQSRNISGDQLNIEGNSVLELLYSDLEKNTIRCFKTEIPFSQNLNIKNSSQFSAATFDIKREYINCRAISPRRIDIHGAFSLKINVFGTKNCEVTNDIASDEIKQKKSDVSFSQLNSLLQHQINISEILDLGTDKNAPEFIIKSDLNISDINCSASDERINIKGKVNIKILYISDIETGKTDSVENEIPINETIDAPGVMDDNIFMIIPEIIYHEEKISADSESIGNLINEELKIMMTIFAFQDDETKIIDDAYSTEYETELSCENFKFKKFSGALNENIIHKEIIKNSDNKFFKILDIWSNSYSVGMSQKDLNSSFEGKINLCILALNPDFVPFYIEREIKFSKELYENIDSKISDSYIFMSITDIDYKIINNDEIEVKLNIQIIANMYNESEYNLVENITSNESSPKIKDLSTALTIYYANAGEKIWDIAKHYGTTMEKIQDENDIDFEVLDSDRAILIPIY
jgi:hypothetical protein